MLFCGPCLLSCLIGSSSVLKWIQHRQSQATFRTRGWRKRCCHPEVSHGWWCVHQRTVSIRIGSKSTNHTVLRIWCSPSKRCCRTNHDVTLSDAKCRWILEYWSLANGHGLCSLDQQSSTSSGLWDVAWGTVDTHDIRHPTSFGWLSCLGMPSICAWTKTPETRHQNSQMAHALTSRCTYGFFPRHSILITLILNLGSGSIAPQFHVVFDDMFHTVASQGDDLPEIWSRLIDCGPCHMQVMLDDDGDFELHDDWLGTDERTERDNWRRQQAVSSNRDTQLRTGTPIAPVERENEPSRLESPPLRTFADAVTSPARRPHHCQPLVTASFPRVIASSPRAPTTHSEGAPITAPTTALGSDTSLRRSARVSCLFCLSVWSWWSSHGIRSPMEFGRGCLSGSDIDDGVWIVIRLYYRWHGHVSSCTTCRVRWTHHRYAICTCSTGGQ